MRGSVARMVLVAVAAVCGCHGRTVGVLPEDAATDGDATIDSTLDSSVDSSTEAIADASCVDGTVDGNGHCVAVFDVDTCAKTPAQISVLGGGCATVGVTTCAAGFTADGNGGCTPTIISTNCGGSSYPALGSTSCVEVGGFCNLSTRWPDPVAGAIYVDASSTAASPDGSIGAPYPSLAAALGAHAGAPIKLLLADGIYDAGLEISDDVTIIGHCATKVQLRSASAAFPVLLVHGNATLRQLEISGGNSGVAADSTTSTTLDIGDAWIHDATDAGVHAVGAVRVRIGTSLLENMQNSAVYAASSGGTTIDATTIRSVNAGTSTSSGDAVVSTGSNTSVTITGSVFYRVANHLVEATHGDVHVRGSFLHSTIGTGAGDDLGAAIFAHPDSGVAMSVEVTQSVIDDVAIAAIDLGTSNVTLTVADSVLSNATVLPDGTGGVAVVSKGASSMKITSTLFNGNPKGGVVNAGGTAEIDDCIFRGARDAADGTPTTSVISSPSVSGSGAPPSLTMIDDLFDGNDGWGIVVLSSHADIRGCDVRRQAGVNGVGIVVATQKDAHGLTRASADITASIFDTAEKAGVWAVGSDVVLSSSWSRCSGSADAILTTTLDGNAANVQTIDGTVCGCPGAFDVCKTSEIPFP